uniref:Methylcrotonoyl-CoA carboxylase beta chain, mitochondrial n=1 Tax=Lygus hesperus TaxID=30085 RepID=A0A0A9X888_LYGHE
MTVCVIAIAFGTILASTLSNFYIVLVSSVICCCMSFYALPRVIARANVFSFLQMVFYIQMQGLTDSFYMATPDCLPDAPHFSYTFYNTIGQMISNLAAIAGVTGFTYVFSKRGYRLTMCITTLIQIFASIFDIVIVKR